jgi:type VI secretion system protein ImpF
MAGIADGQQLLPSVLDRLLDDEPGVSREPPRGRNQVLRDMKKAVQRDLENLLNTRRRCLPRPDGQAELAHSLVNYGLPDFSGVQLASPDAREEFRSILEGVLREWEPRFQTVRVTLLDTAEPLDRTLRFRIDALLYAQPAPEPVVFDSSLEPGTGSFKIGDSIEGGQR